MHYYKFNIGDYVKSTLHLSTVEDLAYRRLLDRYYDTEKPLESDIEKLCRFIRMAEYQKETQQVLEEFFSLTKNGWIQKRVQKELMEYSGKAEIARANGKKGGRPKKTQRVIFGNPDQTQQKAKHKTLNIKQETLNNSNNRATKMPKDWHPNEKHRELAGKLNISISDQLERFTDYCHANGKTYKDWNAGFRNWLRNAKDFQRGGDQPRPGGKEFTGF